MSVRFRKRTNSLAAMVDNPNGMRVEDALRKADTNLESIKDILQVEVEKNLDELIGLLDGAATRPDANVLNDAYLRSNQVSGMAGTAGLAPLGQAAFSLCELLDRLSTAGRWNAEAVAVHLNAMRLLRKAQELTGESKHILMGLREVVTRATA